MSRLDQLYRSVLLTKFFTKGWGNPANLKRLLEFRKILSNRETCQHLVSSDYPVTIDKDEERKEYRLIEGYFLSPFTKHLPGIMPKEIETARFQMILPRTWREKDKPVCVHLAGTGDHYFWRRRKLMAEPLLKESGIASILLENPYYGVRKPKQQIRSSLHNVSDLFVMGGALVLESLVLFHWCERQGYGPLGITGISMGGHMASLAATNWTKPLVLVPCLSWSTASAVFTQGVMSGAIPWKLLQEQYFADHSFEDDVAKLIESPEQNLGNEAFQMGQNFSRKYMEDSTETERLNEEVYSEFKEISRVANAGVTAAPNISNATATPNITEESKKVLRGVTTTASNSPGTARYHTVSTSDGTAAKNPLISKISSLLPRLLGSGRGAQCPQEVLHFMRGVMDECTHLGNFSTPVDTKLVIIIAARSDAYIPRDSVLSLEKLWPGAEVRYINTGHISAFLFKQNVFRQAITDAFERQRKKYYS